MKDIAKREIFNFRNLVLKSVTTTQLQGFEVAQELQVQRSLRVSGMQKRRRASGITSRKFEVLTGPGPNASLKKSWRTSSGHGSSTSES